MKNLIAFALALMLVGFFSLNTAAQEKKEQLWLVSEEVVKPDMVEQYKEACKDLLKLCKEENFPYTYNVWVKDYFTYDLWYPIDELNDIIKIEEAWDDIVQKYGEDNFKKFQVCIESQMNRVMANRLDLSYQPDSFRLSEEEVKYSKLQEIYVEKGSEKKVEELFKRGNALLQEKGIQNANFIGVGKIGYEQPVYFSWSYGKDRLDLLEQRKENAKLLGDEFKPINAELVKYLIRIDDVEDWWIKELSYEKEAP